VSHQIRKGILMIFDLNKLNKLLQPFFSKPLNSTSKNIVLFLGKTGVGKSTTINYLLNYKFQRGRGGHAYPLNPAILPPAQMGDSMETITIYPEVYDSECGFALCDCPGFEKDCDVEMQITRSLCMQMMVSQASSIRSVVVVIDYQSIVAERAKGLKDAALTLGQLLGKSTNLSRSILFIVTRLEEGIDKPYLLEQINKVIKAEESKLKEKIYPDSSALLLVGERNDSENLNAIELLKLMYATPSNLILIDIFDRGQSQSVILSCIKRSQDLSTDSFNFMTADKETIKFKQLLKGEMETFNRMLVSKLEAEETIKAMREKLAQGEKTLKQADYELFKLRNSDTDMEKNYEAIYKPSDIQIWKQRIEEIRVNKEGLDRELAELDVPDVIRYQAVKENRNSGVIFNKQRFFYRDIPYVRVETSYSKGSLRVKHDNPSRGFYEATFKSNVRSDTWATVNIYCQKNLIPKYAERIKELNRDIKILDMQIKELTDLVADIENKIRNKQELQRHILNKISIRNTNGKLKNQITAEESRLLQVTKKIEDKESLSINLIANIKVLIPMLHLVFPEIEKLSKTFLANCDSLGLRLTEREDQTFVVKSPCYN
jgi:GTP-binding protein EngB required for normal cell division